MIYDLNLFVWYCNITSVAYFMKFRFNYRTVIKIGFLKYYNIVQCYFAAAIFAIYISLWLL